jgi:hypothetical protein
MSHAISNIATNHRRNLSVLSSLFALVILAFVASAAEAQNSWQVNISEKELKLEHPVDMMWDKWLMWDIGYQRMMCRNTPYIELLNEVGSTSPITEFRLTIGDNRFNFAPVQGTDLALLGSTTPGFALSSNTTGGLGDELVVTIGNGGLAPGQLLRFQINIDVDASFLATYKSAFGDSQPDYRTVLFDMNGLNVYDGVVNPSSADNGKASVVFNPGGLSEVVPFDDEPVAAGQFFNSNLRQYRDMDPVLIFQLEGGTAIPEPASLGLLFVGISAGVLARRRPRIGPLAA